MPKILDWRKTEDPRDVIHTAVQALAEGHLVAFPNDGHYIVAASGLRGQAISKLKPLTVSNHTHPGPHAFLMMRSIHEVQDYCPKLSEVAIRIGQRCWPGPVDLVLEDMPGENLIRSLPNETRELILGTDNLFGVSCPRHEAVQQVARLTAGPLIIAPVFRAIPSILKIAERGSHSPKADHENFELATETSHIPEEVAFVVDSGLIERQGPSTLVRVQGNRCEVLREGLMTIENLSASTSFTILLVCTGNTCRSPMAEVMLRSKLNIRVASQGSILDAASASVDIHSKSQAASNKISAPAPENQNDYFTFRVISAGVSAQPGGPASDGAMLAMQERGLNLQDHQSRTISQGLLERSDLILTMTSNHRQAILSRWPQVIAKTFCLAPTGVDVSDPYGGPVEAYRKCAVRIDQFLDAWINQLNTDLFPTWIKI